ncbi:secreted RxLR effector protein 161-like [Aristolochia californica]|uniref:secreted RxLR effector protein 161-like n=1 Tax=Aristolochia californica TaxID=171875 RepID=UPI0035D7E48F
MDNVPYVSTIGSLMYEMVCTRPDIAHAVGVVSKYMSNLGYLDADIAGDIDGKKITTGYRESEKSECVNSEAWDFDSVAETETLAIVVHHHRRKSEVDAVAAQKYQLGSILAVA